MKLYTVFILMAGITLLLDSCDTKPEPLELMKPYSYDDQYYENLRAYKESDHQIFYGWYADYAQTFSPGMHFNALPDSIDIISLWGGIPSMKMDDSLTQYNPVAYEEMRFVQKVKGTKMLSVHITRMEQESWTTLSEEGIIEYGDYLLRGMFENDLDGLDLDYEPEGDWLSGERFLTLVEYLGQFVGPMSENPDLLLVIDYYSTRPPAEVEPYINYLVNQAYTQGITENSASHLQSRYDLVADWCPPEKFIVTENIGDWWQEGGSPFTEFDGNTISPVDGERMHSMEGMARWNPEQGPKGGFGAFYFIRDYNSDPPYKYVKRSIQSANPAVR